METLGVRFVPDDQELVEYLRHHDAGRTLHSFGAINEAIDPYSFRPEELPNVRRDGSYYYADRNARNRRTLDGSGYWKSRDKQTKIHTDSGIVGYKRKFKFCLGPSHSNSNSNLSKWKMTEYTLRPDTSHGTRNALCVIRMTAGNQGNEIREAIPNPRLPELDDEDIYGQLSPLLELDDMGSLPSF